MAKPSVQITHPEGASMRFSESLARYLIGRQDKSKPFFIGAWLATLNDVDVEDLRALAERWAADDESHDVDDFVGVVVTAQAIERQRNTVGERQLVEHLQCFVLVTHVESFRRNGWLQLEAPLSLLPECSLKVRVTDEGIRAGERMAVLGGSLFH
jgi:hypothetical protein